MERAFSPGKSVTYERLSRWFIGLLLLAAVAVELAVPIVAWRWTQQPFPGALFEHTLIINNMYKEAGESDFPPNPSARLITIDGQPVARSRDVTRILQSRSAGQSVTLTFEPRDGSALLELPVVLHSFPASAWVSLFWLPYLVGVAYLAIGIWVFRHRGERRPGQSFALLSAFVALATGTLFDLNTTHVFTRVWTAAMPLIAAALLHLAMVFPEESALTRRRPLLRFLPYPFALALALVGQLRLYTPGDPWGYIAPWRWSYSLLGLAAVVFMALMLYTRARTVSGLVRQQVRIILIGGFLAFLPITVYMILAGLALPIRFQTVIYLPPLILFPLFIAFAILRYKLLGLDLAFSRGLAYAILTAGGAVVYFVALALLVAVLGLDADTLDREAVQTLPWFLGLLVVGLMFLLNPLRDPVERFVGRLIGRRRVNYRQALQTFSRELLTTPLELPAILERLVDQIEPASHSAPTLVFLYDPNLAAYTLRRVSGFVPPEGRDLRFAADSGLVQWLADRKLSFYLLDAEFQAPSARFSDWERDRIKALGLVLFLPLQGRAQLEGWVALGPRLSGEPYSPDDLAFLTALVDQAAMAVENARLLADAHQRADELVALQQTAFDISARHEIPFLLQSIVERATRLLGASGGGVFLLDAPSRGSGIGEDGERLRMVVSYNLGRDYTGAEMKSGEGLTGRVVAQGEPVRVENYEQFADRSDSFADAPVRSVIGVPLKWQGRVIGVLNVADTSRTRRFTQEDEWLLSLFASQAAIALRNAQLFADLERRVLQVDALRQISEAVDLRRDLGELLDLIYAQTSRVLDIDNFYVALYDEGRREFRMAYYVERRERREPPNPVWPLGEGLSSQIVRSRTPLVTDNYLAECECRGVASGGRPARAWLGAPLLSGERVLGVLNVSSFQEAYRFSAEQVGVMTAIAEQAAVAIDRMRLYQEMEARAAELATLNEVSRTINSTLDLSNVLDLIMKKVVEILDVEAGSLLLVDEESGELVFQVALRGSDHHLLAGQRLPVGEGIVGKVAQTGQTLIVNDISSDPRWHQQIDQQTGFATRSILCVPMISRDRTIGVIEVINRCDGSPFSETEANLLTGFAGQAAVAIENARLYTQTDQALARRVEELSTLQRIDRELNATLNFDRVMDMTLDWALRSTEAPVGVIALYDESRQGLLLLAGQGYPPDFERYRTEPWPLDQGISGRVVRSGEPALVADVTQDLDYSPAQQATRSQLTVPIRREQQVIGVVNVESPEVAAFGADDLAFLQRLADHAAIAIENARLYRETERRAEDMALLYDISLTVSSHLALEEVLEAVYQQIQAVWDPPVFFIALYDAVEDALDFPIYVDRGNRLPPFRQNLTDQSDLKPGFTAWIVHNCKPILIREWDIEQATSPVQGIPMGDITQSWLGIPLTVGDQVVGVISVQDYAAGAYGEEHRRFLSTVAREVAIAIENARLHESVKEANQAKSEFIDFVAHELKQPMTSMQGYAKMLTLGIGGELNDMQKGFVRVINSNVDRMGKLVNDLLEISRLEAGRTRLTLAPVRLSDVVDETVATTRTEIDARRHTLTVDVPEDLPPVLADRVRLIQILTNLVSNAYKYTPPGGQIQITANGRDRAETPPGHLLVSVRDNGIGMSPQEIAGLNEKFFRGDHELVREQPGTGLGVSITRSLVELHGGEFLVESTPGAGTTFRFTVPIAAQV